MHVTLGQKAKVPWLGNAARRISYPLTPLHVRSGCLPYLTLQSTLAGLLRVILRRTRFLCKVAWVSTRKLAWAVLTRFYSHSFLLSIIGL